jgi:hypothetical protein
VYLVPFVEEADHYFPPLGRESIAPNAFTRARQATARRLMQHEATRLRFDCACMKNRALRWIGIAVFGLAVGACAPLPPQPAPPPPAEPASVSDRLYFGRNIPGGGTVTERDWAQFLAEVVTPRFPAGLTVWRAEGQWREQSGAIVKEQSFVLELIHGPDPAAERAVQEIAAEYKRRFRQEAVLRVRDRVEIGF